ncbi:MAG: radical SAM protein [Syntrophobacteraceae bacterium]
MNLKVNEIFHSIQGESSYAGMPCVFVRLTGCNLRCAWCDTRYAYEEGETVAIADIAERVRAYGCRLVEVTGGEPLLQSGTPDLVDMLLTEGHRVLLETNGSMDIGVIDPECVRIVDIKCPSSGVASQNCLRNLDLLTNRDELKFVIATHEDYEFAANLVRSATPGNGFPLYTINFSPVFGAVSATTLAEWILRDRLPVRLNLQLHKILWDPNTRGV